VRGNSNRRGVQKWWFSLVGGMVMAHRRKSGGGQEPLVLGMGQTVLSDGGEFPGALFAGSGGSARKGEGWSTRGPLDQSREGEKGGRRNRGPDTMCSHATRRGRGVRYGCSRGEGSVVGDRTRPRRRQVGRCGCMPGSHVGRCLAAVGRWLGPTQRKHYDFLLIQKYSNNLN
jgi:hypothetical protein